MTACDYEGKQFITGSVNGKKNGVRPGNHYFLDRCTGKFHHAPDHLLLVFFKVFDGFVAEKA
jgi:hypothetical protein